jgi:hypothetical protein
MLYPLSYGRMFPARADNLTTLSSLRGGESQRRKGDGDRRDDQPE